MAVDNRQGVQVRVLSLQMVGIWSHFIDGRTKPCTGPQGGCWLDHVKTSNEWHGWLVVKRPDVDEQRLLALTLNACDCAPDLHEEGLILRGMMLRAWRFGESRRAKMGARLYPDDLVSDGLPEAVDVLPQLERMWAAPNRRKDSAAGVWSAFRKGGPK